MCQLDALDPNERVYLTEALEVASEEAREALKDAHSDDFPTTVREWLDLRNLQESRLEALKKALDLLEGRR